MFDRSVEHSVARMLFGFGVAAIGAQMVVTGDLVAELQPVPAWLPGRDAAAYVSGGVLFVAGACIGVGVGVRRAALALVALFGVWLGLMHVPRLIAAPRNGGAWTGAAEVLAFGAVAWLVAGLRVRAGRIAFGLAFPVFGVLHAIYRDYIVFVTPAWIPAKLFWAYATGLAHIAAGLAIATGIQARLAAWLLGAMLGSWVVILHVPRVIDAGGKRAEVTSLLVATALCGGAWLVAGSQRSRSSDSSAAR